MKHTLLCLFFLGFCAAAFAQNTLPEGYYVVVAAYKNTGEGYASRYTEALKQKGHDAHYGLSASGKLYLVYVHYNENRNASLTEMRSERQKGEFPDAWVRVVKAGNPQAEIAKTEMSAPDEKNIAEPVAKTTPPVVA
ncbi:MAG TPA: hypothetical protein VFM90_11790, partial [Cyclobacteriaceae bacterium]|nr:hypothetical protein [Cyclobacteriaceae bacterium]